MLPPNNMKNYKTTQSFNPADRCAPAQLFVGAPQGRIIGSSVSCDRLRSDHNRLQATYMNNMKQRTRKR